MSEKTIVYGCASRRQELCFIKHPSVVGNLKSNRREVRMKKMMLTVMAAALLVAFSAPSFAGDDKKKEERRRAATSPRPSSAKRRRRTRRRVDTCPRPCSAKRRRRTRKRAATKNNTVFGEASWLERSPISKVGDLFGLLPVSFLPNIDCL